MPKKVSKIKYIDVLSSLYTDHSALWSNLFAWVLNLIFDEGEPNCRLTVSITLPNACTSSHSSVVRNGTFTFMVIWRSKSMSHTISVGCLMIHTPQSRRYHDQESTLIVKVACVRAAITKISPAVVSPYLVILQLLTIEKHLPLCPHLYSTSSSREKTNLVPTLKGPAYPSLTSRKKS
jgi:hypothetical protein